MFEVTGLKVTHQDTTLKEHHTKNELWLSVVPGLKFLSLSQQFQDR